MKFAACFGFPSLNRIFFSKIDTHISGRSQLTQHIGVRFSTSLLNFFVVFLLPASSLVLSFPSSGLSAPLVGVDIQSLPDILTADIDDTSRNKLDQFASAYLQILQLLSNRQSELPEDETSPAALEIQQSIEADTIKIIEGSGLTLPEYMQILNMASQDETFQRKVFDRSMKR